MILGVETGIESALSSRTLSLMELFETKLSRAIQPDNREILGAIAAVVDREGKSLLSSIPSS